MAEETVAQCPNCDTRVKVTLEATEVICTDCGIAYNPRLFVAPVAEAYEYQYECPFCHEMARLYDHSCDGQERAEIAAHSPISNALQLIGRANARLDMQVAGERQEIAAESLELATKTDDLRKKMLGALDKQGYPKKVMAPMLAMDGFHLYPNHSLVLHGIVTLGRGLVNIQVHFAREMDSRGRPTSYAFSSITADTTGGTLDHALTRLGQSMHDTDACQATCTADSIDACKAAAKYLQGQCPIHRQDAQPG